MYDARRYAISTLVEAMLDGDDPKHVHWVMGTFDPAERDEIDRLARAEYARQMELREAREKRRSSSTPRRHYRPSWTRD